jgi:hypothetical protein
MYTHGVVHGHGAGARRRGLGFSVPVNIWDSEIKVYRT